MSLLSIRARGAANWTYVYNTDGTLLTGYDLPIGAIEGVNAYELRSHVGAPDGTVYYGATLDSQAYILQVQPETGAIIRRITLAGITTLEEGYTLLLLSSGNFLVVCTSASTVLKEFNQSGTVVTSYSITAGTVGCIGLGADGTNLYYRVKGTTIVAGWDLVNDVAGTNIGDLGVQFQGQFVMLPDNRLLGLYLTSQPVVKLINADGSVSVVYTPANTTNGSTGGMAYDVSAGRVYVTSSNNADASGILSAFDQSGGSPLYESTITLHPVANLVGRVVLTPPNGSPRPYPVGETTVEQIYRQRTAPWLSHNQVMLFFNDAQLDCQTGYLPADGVSAMIAWQWTADGHTWTPLEWVPYGEVGEYLFRVRMGQPFGQARQKAARVTMTSAVPVAWLRMLVDITQGLS